MITTSFFSTKCQYDYKSGITSDTSCDQEFNNTMK